MLRDDTSPVKACIKSMSEAKPHLVFSALSCVLNTKANAMEATLAKTVNDLFMVFSLECAGSSVRCSVVMHEYAGQERSAK